MMEKELVELALLVLKFAAVLARSQEEQEACIDIAVEALARATALRKDGDPTTVTSKIPF